MGNVIENRICYVNILTPQNHVILLTISTSLDELDLYRSMIWHNLNMTTKHFEINKLQSINNQYSLFWSFPSLSDHPLFGVLCHPHLPGLLSSLRHCSWNSYLFSNSLVVIELRYNSPCFWWKPFLSQFFPCLWWKPFPYISLLFYSQHGWFSNSYPLSHRPFLLALIKLMW